MRGEEGNEDEKARGREDIPTVVSSRMMFPLFRVWEDLEGDRLNETGSRFGSFKPGGKRNGGRKERLLPPAHPSNSVGRDVFFIQDARRDLRKND